MKTFRLLNVREDFTLSIGDFSFELKEGKSYKFEYATSDHVKKVLKYLAKHKGLFRYSQSEEFVNCFETFSLARLRADIKKEENAKTKGGKKKAQEETELVQEATIVIPDYSKVEETNEEVETPEVLDNDSSTSNEVSENEEATPAEQEVSEDTGVENE